MNPVAFSVAPILIVGLLLAVGCSPASEARVEAQTAVINDPDPMNFGRKDETDSFISVCRSNLTATPPVFTMLDFTAEQGGYTCNAGGQGVLFVPQRKGRCPIPQTVKTTTPEVMSVDQASQEFVACSAFGRAGATKETGLIVFQPRGQVATPDIERDFLKLGNGVIILSRHDALPVTALFWGGDLGCVEASDPGVALARILASDLADPQTFDARVERGTCRETFVRLTGTGILEPVG